MFFKRLHINGNTRILLHYWNSIEKIDKEDNAMERIFCKKYSYFVTVYVPTTNHFYLVINAEWVLKYVE